MSSRLTGARRLVVACLVAALAVLCQATTPAGAASLGLDPPGANDWTCRPSAQHPRPVVLVHGTFANKLNNWTQMSPALKGKGFCVFALNYGSHDPTETVNGTDDIRESARELAAFVDQVLTATGAAKVDLVGHSQGGMMPRYFIKYLGGDAKVGTLVGLAPSNHGTSASGIAQLQQLPGVPDTTQAQCQACVQQFTGSEFLTDLNAGSETDPDVRYAVIVTVYDTVVTPYTSGFLAPGPNVVNEVVQRDYCALDPVDHVGVAFDPLVIRSTLHHLDPSLPAVTSCL